MSIYFDCDYIVIRNLCAVGESSLQRRQQKPSEENYRQK